jgi:hypothetical protein
MKLQNTNDIAKSVERKPYLCDGHQIWKAGHKIGLQFLFLGTINQSNDVTIAFTVRHPRRLTARAQPSFLLQLHAHNLLCSELCHLF